MATIMEIALRNAGLKTTTETAKDAVAEMVARPELAGLTTSFTLKEEGVEVTAIGGGREVYVIFPHGSGKITVAGWFTAAGLQFDRRDRKKIPMVEQVARKILAHLADQADMVRSWGGDVKFLPAGTWPQAPRTGKSQPRQSRPPAQDYGRFAFLRAQSPEATTGRFTAFGKDGEREYSLFIFRGRTSGRPVGILDCPVEGNAIYAFWADQPNWLAVALWTKGEIVKKSPPEFVGYLRHHEGWQGRFIELLARL